MIDDLPPFFIAPHRFDAPGQPAGTAAPAQPRLDRRHALLLEEGEQVLWADRLRVSGYLLGPTETHRHWVLNLPVLVTVTDRRLAYVCAGWKPTLVGTTTGARHRRHRSTPERLVTGELRWQWPSRLELLAGPGGTEHLLVVCDTLRTIRQPALALAPLTDAVSPVRDLARIIRRAAAGFRLANPDIVELSPVERDALTVRASSGLFVTEFGDTTRGVTLPGALPIEFRHRDDYYRRTRSRPSTAGRYQQSDPLMQSTLS